MKCTINNKEYDFHISYQKHDKLRTSLNILAKKIFGGLSFDKWYHQGYWNENCIPYALFVGQKCVANIFVNIFHITIIKMLDSIGFIMFHCIMFIKTQIS